MVLEYWIIPYKALGTISTDRGTQITSSVFAKLCAFLRTSVSTTTRYLLIANKHLVRYIRSLVARLRLCVDENKQDLKVLSQTFIDAYNTQLHRTARTTPLSFKLCHKPPGSLTPPRTMPTNKNYCTLPLWRMKLKVLDQLHHLMQKRKCCQYSSSIIRTQLW